MASAGYGNHVTSDPKLAERDKPNEAGREATPFPADGKPQASKDTEQRHEATPGTGALPGPNAGDDVDPRAG